jgi:RimJ/RimL family protein N-acetyltransferase
MAMHRIYAFVDTRNDRSWRLMERIGMRREGHFVRWRKIKNEWIDDYGYAMLANEWRPEVALEIQSRTPAS